MKLKATAQEQLNIDFYIYKTSNQIQPVQLRQLEVHPAFC